MELPPLVGKGPRLKSDSISPTPELPSVPLRKVDVCRSPHFHLDISLPNAASVSLTAAAKDLAIMSSRVSTTSLVALSSQKKSFGFWTSWRITSFQREPLVGQ